MAGSILADALSPIVTKVVSNLVAPNGHEVYIKAPGLYLEEGGGPLTGWQARCGRLWPGRRRRSGRRVGGLFG